MKRMYGASVLHRKYHFLFTFSVFVFCIVVSSNYYLLFFFTCGPNVACFSGLSILGCPSVFSNVHVLNSHLNVNKNNLFNMHLITLFSQVPLSTEQEQMN